MAGNIHSHPAPGLGDLMPGWFSVPQNSVTDGVTYTPGIGDILATDGYSVPQNPILDYMKGQVTLIGQQKGPGPGMLNGQPVSMSAGTSGAGCGCGGACAGGGMGDISSDFTTFTNDLTSGNIMQAIQDPIFGVPVWAIAGGLALAIFMGGSESHYSRTRRAVRAY
jgi:hypothetical protein